MSWPEGLEPRKLRATWALRHARTHASSADQPMNCKLRNVPCHTRSFPLRSHKVEAPLSSRTVLDHFQMLEVNQSTSVLSHGISLS